MRARWLEVYDTTTSAWIQRRIRDVYSATYNPPDGPILGYAASDFIVVDQPWDTLGETGLSWRIYTDEYPYPEESRLIVNALYDPNSTSPTALYPADRQGMIGERVNTGWRMKTRPRSFADGNRYQLPAPHYTPVGINSTENSELWGFDAAAGEHGDPALPGQSAPQYGAGGVFSYKVVHVWGRRPWANPTKRALLQAFYMSAPSKASEQVTVAWGGPAAVVSAMADIEYDLGYGPDSTYPSYHHSGVEKWIFRARHSYEDPDGGNNNAAHKRPQSDGVYYLWRIVAGSTVSVVDRGDYDPVDYEYPLVPVHGYYHLRLNSLPVEGKEMWIEGRRKEKKLEYDTDVPRAPAEASEAILTLMRCFSEGRNGNTVFNSPFFKDYEVARAAMRADQVSPKHQLDTFGDGLGTSLYQPQGLRFNWVP